MLATYNRENAVGVKLMNSALVLDSVTRTCFFTFHDWTVDDYKFIIT